MGKVTLKNGKNVGQHIDPPKRRGWRYFLTWFAGFLSAGLIVGIVALVLSTSFTSKEVLSLFGVNADAILQPYYQGLSILKLASTLPTLKYETLGDIYQITPMVRQLVEETINPVLEKELHFGYDWDEISTKPFKLPVEAREDDSVDPSEDLSTYIGRAIKEGVYLKDFFSADSIPSLVNLFLYPKDEYGEFDYSNPYCLMDFISADSAFFDNIMNSIKIKDVISNPDHFPLLEEEGGIGGWSINDFTNDNINGLSLGLFIDQGTTSPLMQEISSWTVGDLKEGTKFDDLELGLFINGSSDPLMQELSTWKVSDLKDGSKINNLTLGLLIGPTTDPLLQELSTWSVADVKQGDKIDSLTLGLFLDPNSTDPFIQEISSWTIADIKQGDVIDELTLGLFLEQGSSDPLIQELSTWKISDLKDTSNFKNLELGKIIAINSSTPQIIVKLINDHYTIGMLETTNLYNVLTVGDVFDTSDNRLLAALDDKYLSQLEDEEVILNLKIGDVLPSSGDSIVAKFSEKTLKQISELDIHNIELTQIFSDAEINSDPVLKSLIAYDEHIKIGELSNPEVLTSLKLGDILTDTSNPIINALKDYSISQIPSKINTLSLGTLLDIDPTDPSTPSILMALKDEPLNSLSTRINALTLGEILDINPTDPSTTQLMKTLAGKTINQLNDFLSHIKLGDVMDFSDYPNLDNDEVKNTEINDIDDLIDTLKDHLKLKDVVDITTSSPQILQTLQNEYLKDLEGKITTLTLGDFMTITSTSHPFLQALSGYTLSELEGAIPNIKLSQVMTITQEESHPLLWELRDSSLATLSDDITTKLNDLKLNQIMTISGTSHPLLQALGNTPISELEDAIPNIELGSVISIDSSSPQLLKTLVENHVTISTLSSSISSMTLSDMVNIDPDDPATPQILIALKDIQILDGSSLVDKVNSLKLNDIYKESDCVGVFKYLWDENDHGNLAITQIPSAVNNLPLTTLLADYIYVNDDTQAKYYDVVTHVYYSYSDLIDDHTHSPTGHDVIKYLKINPIYWFLLTEEGETFSSDEKYYVLKNGNDYTINNGLGNITDNFSYHMKSEKLYDLYDAGLLDTSVLSRTELGKQFVDPNTHATKIVGNLTMSEFLSICIQLLPSLPNP